MNNLADVVPLLAVFGSAVVFGTGYTLWQRYSQRAHGTFGFVQKRLLTPNEVDFYHRLLRALGPRWTVLAQVSMGALMDTSLKPRHPRYWPERNLFAAKICDFVICDARTLQPQLVVELDDVMHDFGKDRKRDTTVAHAGYRTLRFWSRKKPSDSELRDVLAKALALN